MKPTVIVLSLVTALLGRVGAPSRVHRATAAVPNAPVASAPLTRPALFDRTRFLWHAGVAFFILPPPPRPAPD